MLHGSTGVAVISIVSVVVVIGMFLVYRTHRADPKTRRTRFGVYVERDRFEEPDEIIDPDEDDTRILRRHE